jgi:hypothetical protein
MAHVRQSQPDSGLGFLLKVLFDVFPLGLDAVGHCPGVKPRADLIQMSVYDRYSALTNATILKVGLLNVYHSRGVFGHEVPDIRELMPKRLQGGAFFG